VSEDDDARTKRAPIEPQSTLQPQVADPEPILGPFDPNEPILDDFEPTPCARSGVAFLVGARLH
jgi:hypothetical protein